MSQEKQSKRQQSEASKEAGRQNTLAMLASTEHRGATRHGVHTVIQSGGEIIPAVSGAAAVAEDVDRALAQIDSDLGGDLSGAQREILRACRVPMIVLRLAEAYLIKNDVVDRKGRVRGILRIVGVYSNALRHNLVALGLNRIPKHLDSLESTAEEIVARRRNVAVENGEGSNGSQE